MDSSNRPADATSGADKLCLRAETLFLVPRDGGQLLEYVIAGARAVRFISGRKNAFQNIGGRRIYYAIRNKLPQESSGPVDSPITDGAAERQEHGNQCIDNRLVHNASLAAPI